MTHSQQCTICGTIYDTDSIDWFRVKKCPNCRRPPKEILHHIKRKKNSHVDEDGYLWINRVKTKTRFKYIENEKLLEEIYHD